MMELLNQSNEDASAMLSLANQASTELPEGVVPPLALEAASSNVLQLASNKASAAELWVALGGRALSDEVGLLKSGMLEMRQEISPGRWEELRERHADLSRLVAVMQDMHCNNVKQLWEDLRAVCRELGTVSAASNEAAAQAA